jgi:transposase
MSIAGAFDVHRRQLAFEYLDTVTGELKPGRVVPAGRPHLRAWLARFAGQDDVHFALEGCTGWRYVTEELAAAGITPHLAGPADTAALRGRKRHAKTDRADARHLRARLLAGDLPECRIPPEHALEARAIVRLHKDLVDERGAWHQRIAATLFHQACPRPSRPPTRPAGPRPPGRTCRRPGGRRRRPGCARSAGCPPSWDPLRRQLDMDSRRQPGCAALRAARCGIGAVTPVAIWAEPGDVRRSASPDEWPAAPGWTSPSAPPTSSGPRGGCPARDRRCCAGRCVRRPGPPPAPPHRTTATTPQPGTAATAGWPPCRWPAN